MPGLILIPITYNSLDVTAVVQLYCLPLGINCTTLRLTHVYLHLWTCFFTAMTNFFIWRVTRISQKRFLWRKWAES